MVSNIKLIAYAYLTFVVISVPEFMTNETVFILKLKIVPFIAAIYKLKMHFGNSFPISFGFTIYSLQLLIRIYKASPVSELEVDDPGLCQRTSGPFSKRVHQTIP